MSQQPVPGESTIATGRPVEAVLAEQALDWLQVNVLKLLVTRVIPLVLASGLVTGALAWLQDTVGVDLPPSVLATICFTAMAGVVGAATAYVKNHAGAAHLATAVLELRKFQATLPPTSEGWAAAPTRSR